MKQYYVYILASKPLGTLYIGVTNDPARRMYEHRNGLVEGFAKKYSVKQLVYFEEANSAEAAILREKQLKKWERAWKVRLIEKNNPLWQDLSESVLGMDSRLRENDSSEGKV